MNEKIKEKKMEKKRWKITYYQFPFRKRERKGRRKDDRGEYRR